MTGIRFSSVCAHPFLPFFGTAHVAYLPADRLAGLSRLARAVEFFARRPQMQERWREQVADGLENRLGTRGALAEEGWRREFLARLAPSDQGARTICGGGQ